MLSKWCQTTSCNGIINLYEARENKPLFIFWSVLMLLMLGASVFFTYKAIQGYIDSPYATSIATISNSSLFYPEIMICYNGGYNVSAFKEANFSDDFIYAFMNDAISAANIRNVSTSESRNQFLNYKNKYTLSNRQIYDRFEFTYSDIVKSLYPLSFTYTFKKVSSFDGSCFALKNLGFQYRLAHGIFLELSSPKNSYASVFGNENDEMTSGALTISRDFLINMEQTLDVHAVSRYNRIPINSRVDIVLYPKLYKRIFNGNQCEPNETKFPTSNSCYSRCDAELSQIACNCTLIQYADVDNSGDDFDVCPPFHPCDFLVDNLKIDYITRREKCSLECVQKCQQWTYDPIMTFSPIDEKFIKNHSYIHILYDNLQYQKIEEIESFTYDMAIANVGGQCGLWLGASIVTFIEVLYYLVLTITNYVDCNANSNSDENRTEKWAQKLSEIYQTDQDDKDEKYKSSNLL